MIFICRATASDGVIEMIGQLGRHADKRRAENPVYVKEMIHYAPTRFARAAAAAVTAASSG